MQDKNQLQICAYVGARLLQVTCVHNLLLRSRVVYRAIGCLQGIVVSWRFVFHCCILKLVRIFAYCNGCLVNFTLFQSFSCRVRKKIDKKMAGNGKMYIEELYNSKKT